MRSEGRREEREMRGRRGVRNRLEGGDVAVGDVITESGKGGEEDEEDEEG